MKQWNWDISNLTSGIARFYRKWSLLIKKGLFWPFFQFCRSFNKINGRSWTKLHQSNGFGLIFSGRTSFDGNRKVKVKKLHKMSAQLCFIFFLNKKILKNEIKDYNNFPQCQGSKIYQYSSEYSRKWYWKSNYQVFHETKILSKLSDIVLIPITIYKLIYTINPQDLNWYN